MMQTSNRPGDNAGPEVRLRTLRILWAVFLLAVGMFVIVTVVGRPAEEARAEADGGIPTLLPVLALVGLTSVVASFVLKASFFKRAAEQQQPALVHTGFILAMVLCEAAALLGLVGVFVTGNGYAYLLFALGGLGEALHFPRREQLLAAYYKRVG